MDPGEIRSALEELAAAVRTGEVEPPAALRLLLDRGWLTHPSAPVRERAVRFCHAARLREADAHVLARLDDPDPIVRLVAVAFFEILPSLPPEHLARLKSLLDDPDETVRERLRRVFFDVLPPDVAAREGITWVRHPISPWQDRVALPSPDKLLTAVFDGLEVAMGAPTRGTIDVQGWRIQDANASMIWSPDSRRLAFPRWTSDLRQTLVVADIPTRRLGEHPGAEAVFVLHAFTGDRLRVGINPLTRDRMAEVALDHLRWS